MGKEICFSQKGIDKLRPSGRRYRDEYRDKKEPGLFLFVTSGGVKTFYLYRRFQGRPLRMKIGRFPDMPVAVARQKVQQLKGQMALGENPKITTQDWQNVTLSQIADEYIEARKNTLKASSLNVYETSTRTALSCWLSLPIASISKEKLANHYAALVKERGKGAANTAMRVFCSYFNYFIERYDYAGVNPIKTLSANRLWQKTKRRQRYISDTDMPKWFRGVMQLDETWRDYLLFLLFTGLRKEEAARLRWEDVDFDHRSFTIRETKNGNSHQLPLSQFLFELLTSRKDIRSQFVFPSQTRSDRNLVAGNIAGQVSDEIGIKFSLHDLRRTFSTIADGVGCSHYTIKALLNHKTGADVTQGYIMRESESLRDPMKKIAKQILELTRTPSHLSEI